MGETPLNFQLLSLSSPVQTGKSIVPSLAVSTKWSQRQNSSYLATDFKTTLTIACDVLFGLLSSILDFYFQYLLRKCVVVPSCVVYLPFTHDDALYKYVHILEQTVLITWLILQSEKYRKVLSVEENLKRSVLHHYQYGLLWLQMTVYYSFSGVNTTIFVWWYSWI